MFFTFDRPDSKLVDEIVKDVLKKLNDISPSSDCEALVGLESHVEQVKSLLCTGLSDFRVLGIWGMGGIGKKPLLKLFSTKFLDSLKVVALLKMLEKNQKNVVD